MVEHKVEIVGNRPSDNSLIYKCTVCRKTGLGLLGACTKNTGQTGRRKKYPAKER